MATAEVGDDVFEDDPTVKKLEEMTAAILGKEAALFVPSGTMANQICLRVLCEPGDEVICERKAHIVNDEAAAASAISGIMLSPLDGQKGRITPEQLKNAIRGENIHYPKTKLLALENTHNRAGGVILDPAYVNQVAEIAGKNSLIMYLDGARLWNASAALKISPAEIAAPFEMVSVCFSKGLGAPIGSAVSGEKKNVARARRIRKMLGGGMRQVGIIAAAAIYALDNNRHRLVDDHTRARRLAENLAEIPGVEINPLEVQTNIVIFKISKPVDIFLKRAALESVLLVPFGPSSIRAVTHLDISDEDILGAIEGIAKALKES